MNKGTLAVLIGLLLLTLISLALGGVSFALLLRAQRIGLAMVRDVRYIVAGVEGEVISYTVQVDQEVPIVASVPINEVILVPINAAIPIDTVAVVPVDAGLLGTFDLRVPIRTVVPVDLEVSVPVSQTVDIVTTVQLDFDVPVAIPLDDTPVGSLVEEVGVILDVVEGRLADPLGSDEE